jgi:hypothetical protein
MARLSHSVFLLTVYVIIIYECCSPAHHVDDAFCIRNHAIISPLIMIIIIHIHCVFPLMHPIVDIVLSSPPFIIRASLHFTPIASTPLFFVHLLLPALRLLSSIFAPTRVPTKFGRKHEFLLLFHRYLSNHETKKSSSAAWCPVNQLNLLNVRCPWGVNLKKNLNSVPILRTMVFNRFD